MQEIAITREYYEKLKEQIRAVLGKKYLSGVRVQEVTLDNEYNYVDESFYPLLGINEEQGFVLCYSAHVDVDTTDISRAKYAMMQESFRANLECWNRDHFPGGELARLAVTPAMQSRGNARKMMQHGLDVLKERGYKSIHFLVNKHNVKAIKCYSVFGFNVVGECYMYDQDFLCYEKELS